MSITNDIIKLLKSEGYSINEVIRSAVNDLIELCEEEAADLDDDGLDEDEDDEDDD